jgi:hypothetical protein
LTFLAGIAFAMPAAALDSVEPVDTDYDRMPANTIIPEYPEKARLERIEGEVKVCFDISREGFPQRATWRPIPHGQKAPGIKGCRTFRFTLEPVPLEERD